MHLIFYHHCYTSTTPKEYVYHFGQLFSVTLSATPRFAGPHKPLSWRMRLEVAIGAAKGLDHLHVIATPPVIHRDIKSSNILLDEDWNAKVADFGLSKAALTNASQPASSTFVRGTPGGQCLDCA